MSVWEELHAVVAQNAPPCDTFDPGTHSYFRDGLRVIGVSECLKMANLQDYSMVPLGILEAAAARGTAVHEATALLDQDNLDPDSVDPAIAGYVLSYKRWKELEADHLIIAEIEQFRIAKGVDDLLYGMTFDRRIILGLTDVVVDIKTSAKPARWWPIQLAAYAAYFEMPNMRRAVLHCQKDGSPARLIEYREPKDYHMWNSALRIASWIQRKS